MGKRLLNLEKIQDEHCDMTRTTAKRFRVLRNVGEAAIHFPKDEPVLCIGSGDGFEVEVWKTIGFYSVGLDISSSKRCIALDHGVVSFKNMDGMSGKKFNVYCAHTLEHCANIKIMLDNIRDHCLTTVCLIFPIEQNGSKNPSHLSPITNIDDVHIDGMKTIRKYERWNDEREGFLILKKDSGYSG